MSADTHQQKHPYHLVDPSPWPVIGAIAAFLLAFGTVAFLHPDLLGEGLTKRRESRAAR